MNIIYIMGYSIEQVGNPMIMHIFIPRKMTGCYTVEYQEMFSGMDTSTFLIPILGLLKIWHIAILTKKEI